MTEYVYDQEYNDPQNYYWFEDGFSREETNKILEFAEEVPFQRGNTASGAGDSMRSSNIKWLPKNDKFQWVYRRLMDLSVEANDALWKFDLVSAPELIQYTTYNAEEKGHYGAHQDIGPGDMSLRKVSVTVQISEADDYEGGDLQITQGGDGWLTCPRGFGTTVVFPSYMMHRVTPITKGTRKSLVLWVGGSHYR